MMKIKSTTKKLLRKIASEAADSVMMIIVTGMPFILLFTGWTIDFTKNAAVRSDYINISQEAAQAAVRAQNGSGSLQCGQDSSYESQHDSTGRITLKGTKAAWDFVRAINSDVTSNTDNGKPSSASGWSGSFHSNNAEALALAVQSYLEKTGRYDDQFGDNNSVYNDNVLGGATTGAAAVNDSKFVAAMRSVAGSKEQQEALEGNAGRNVGLAGSDGNRIFGKVGEGEDTFAITVWCSKGVNDQADAGTQSRGTANVYGDNTVDNGAGANTTKHNADVGDGQLVGKGDKFNTISMEIHDWSGNFVLGMFNKDWTIQRYTLTPRAIASWSQNSVN